MAEYKYCEVSVKCVLLVGNGDEGNMLE